jgi:5'-3' exonuclease
MKLLSWTFVGFIALTAGCQRSDREAARERAEHIKTKAEAAAKQLGQDARELGTKVNEKAHEVGATRPSGTEQSPAEKLKRGAAELNKEGQAAGAKLSQVGQSAKVKYNLTAALGLSTVSKIEVDSNGNTVTLRGTVASIDQKQEAERVALETDGVTKIVNKLQVQQ